MNISDLQVLKNKRGYFVGRSYTIPPYPQTYAYSRNSEYMISEALANAYLEFLITTM